MAMKMFLPMPCARLILVLLTGCCFLVRGLRAEWTDFDELAVPAAGRQALDDWTGSELVTRNWGQADVRDAVGLGGSQALELGPVCGVTWTVGGAGSVAFTSFHLRLAAADSAAPEIPDETLSVVLYAGAGGLMALDGDGAGGGSWQVLSGVTTGAFQYITIRRDYGSATYDVYVDGVREAVGFGFKDAGVLEAAFTRIECAATNWLDNVSETLVNGTETDPMAMKAAAIVRPYAPIGALVGIVDARNPDGGAAPAYSIDPVRDSSLFAIDAASGRLTLAAAAGTEGQKYYVDVRAAKSGLNDVVLAIEVTASYAGQTGVVVLVR
jgi:hypothetical protein